MVADLCLDPGRRGTTRDHCVGVGLGQGRAREPAGAAADGAKQRPLGIVHESRLLEVGGQILLERVMTGHGVRLAAFLAQAHPKPTILTNTSSTFMASAAPMRAKLNTMSAISARSRRPAGVITSMLSSTARASADSSTGGSDAISGEGIAAQQTTGPARHQPRQPVRRLKFYGGSGAYGSPLRIYAASGERAGSLMSRDKH